MIEVGTLVKYKYDGDIGLITEVIEDPMSHIYWIKWSDGTEFPYLPTEFEVIA